MRHAGNNRVLRLTDEGSQFAEWLITKGRRCDYFWTPLSGWGEPDPATQAGKWFLEAKDSAASWNQRPLQCLDANDLHDDHLINREAKLSELSTHSPRETMCDKKQRKLL